MFKIWPFLLSISILVMFANTQDIKALAEQTCQSKLECSDCIQTPECKWCKDEKYEGKRCFFNVSNSRCKSESIEDPSSDEIKSPENLLPSNEGRTITPTKATLKLRRGKKLNITMTYTDEKNRPLDLYILMDLSCTMISHKKTVAKLANELAGRLKSLTSDLNIGFGSFVDKPVGPFVSPKPAENQYCQGISLTNTVPHLFKNHLNLTSNIDEFIRTVNDATILTNVDSPEGGLDALMQAISCTEQIGWRSEQKTRRLIVVSTDGPFHIAMDGKLGGIIRPNDGLCHMDIKGEYDQAAVYDYPSVSQVRDRMEEENIYVIFAVTKSQVQIYEKLAKSIGQLSAVQSIDNGSSIADVIKMEYEKVVNKVILRDPSDDIVGVTYYAKCPGSKVYEKRGDCGKLTPGAKVTFEVELELKKCPFNDGRSKEDLWKTNVEIAPYQSIGQNHLLNISLELLCGCDCEKPADSQNRTEDKKCGNQGHLECGICKCNPGFAGPGCNCSTSSGQSVDQELCKDTKSRICGNRGKCVCGECQCDKPYGGKFCECDLNGCFMKKQDQGICNSELGQGTCGCENKCKCNPGFSGSTCGCKLDNESCKDPDSENVCNTFGTCKCGSCLCNEGYEGDHCRYKHAKSQKGSCSKDLVSKIASCVKCLIVENAKIPEAEKFNNCQTPCEDVNSNKINYTSVIGEEGDWECKGSVLDALECNILFIVFNQDVITSKFGIRTEKEAKAGNCVSPAPILPVILGAVGAVLLIGILLLLIWKVLTYIHDKKEFQRFENEKKNATWNLNQNPLYKTTVTEFQNPTFNTE